MKKIFITAVCAFLLTGCANNASAEPSEAPAEETTETAEAAVEEVTPAGKWQLDKVYGVKEDGNMDELDRAENQSLYSVADGYFEFKEDGTGVHVMKDGDDEAEVELTWNNDAGVVVVKEGDGIETEFSFEAGALLQYVDAPEESGYKQYESVYKTIE